MAGLELECRGGYMSGGSRRQDIAEVVEVVEVVERVPRSIAAAAGRSYNRG